MSGGNSLMDEMSDARDGAENCDGIIECCCCLLSLNKAYPKLSGLLYLGLAAYPLYKAYQDIKNGSAASDDERKQSHLGYIELVGALILVTASLASFAYACRQRYCITAAIPVADAEQPLLTGNQDPKSQHPQNQDVSSATKEIRKRSHSF